MPYKFNEPRRPGYPGALPGPELAGIRQGAAATGPFDGLGDAGGLGGLVPTQTGRRGRSRNYSEIAIETGHLLRLAFGRPWRQSEGLLRSLATLLGLDIGVPDHTTFSRRSPGLTLARSLTQAQRTGPVHVVIDLTGLKVYGAGEWLTEKHGERGQRTWRKLHLAVDPNSGEILASELTIIEEGDAALVGPLLDQITSPIASLTADGAYDGEPVYRAVAERQPDPPAAVVIPPPPLPCRARPLTPRPVSATSTSGSSGTRAAWAGKRRSATAGARSGNRHVPLQDHHRSWPPRRTSPSQKTEARVACSVLTG